MSRINIFSIALLVCVVSNHCHAKDFENKRGLCYECYAYSLRAALISKDVEKLKHLIGNEGITRDVGVIDIALGNHSGEFSIRDIAIRKGDIVIKSISSKGSAKAVIYYLNNKLSDINKLDIDFSKLIAFKDYFACEIMFIDGKFIMPENFCFLETDILNPG